MRGKLLGYLQHGGRWLIIDLSGVNYCDAFGLAVLLVTDRRARLLGGGLRLAAPTAVATDALCVSGLHRHFAIYPTTEAAVADHDRLARQRVARAG
jgi:anti-anti-sigma factor